MWVDLCYLKLQLEDIKGNIKGSEVSIEIDEKTNKGVSVPDEEEEEEEDDPISLERREKVKDAMLHAWTSYEKYAWGKDELKVLFHLFCFFFIYFLIIMFLGLLF